MVTLASLWLPILLSASATFIVSAIIHMVLGYHKNDFSGLSSEKQVMDDLRKHNIPPGNYHFPRPKDMKDMKSPEFLEKYKQGPVGFITLMENKTPGMGKELTLWFINSIIVGIFAAYIASEALPAGAEYLSVFRFAGTTAFVGYSLALMQNSIWYKRSWAATSKSMFDGLIYGLLTGGIFGWLWPVM
ncbi:MAG: hypothetical protein ACHQLA_00410 [Ignavibacteriales bacterium]